MEDKELRPKGPLESKAARGKVEEERDGRVTEEDEEREEETGDAKSENDLDKVEFRNKGEREKREAEVEVKKEMDCGQVLRVLSDTLALALIQLLTDKLLRKFIRQIAQIKNEKYYFPSISARKKILSHLKLKFRIMVSWTWSQDQEVEKN